MKKIKVLIIEDDPVWSLFVESIISESSYELIGSANTLLKAKAIIDGLAPDIIISDIRVNDSTVFSLFSNEEYKKIPVVFMTNYLEQDVFNFSATIPKSTFLAKPFHQFTLLSTLDLLIKKYPIEQKESEKFITIRGRQQQTLKIMLDEITWIQAEGNYSFINTVKNRKHAKKKSLSKLLEELDDRFIVVHKGYAVNTKFIQRIDLSNKIIIVQDSQIPIGRGFREALDPFLLQNY